MINDDRLLTMFHVIEIKVLMREMHFFFTISCEISVHTWIYFNRNGDFSRSFEMLKHFDGLML